MQHLAIIMDGNRRWAKQNNKSVREGHLAGINKITEIIKMCQNRSIRYLTLFAFSNENWNRSKEEIDALMELLKFYLKNKKEEFKKQNVKIKVIGRRDEHITQDILEHINAIEYTTKDCDNIQVNIAFNYGGRQEIIDTVKKIVSMNIAIDTIDEKLFNDNLYYGNLPPPDLIVRTSGEQRLSNFLLWEMAYSEFYFAKEYWPEFSDDLLDRIIDDFNKRERRYGK